MRLAPLAPLYRRSGPWASGYVETSVADADTCRGAGEALGSRAHGDEAPGHAVFATRGEVVLDPVPAAPPEGSSSTLGPLPHVEPLPRLAPGLPDCLVVFIDRTGGDLQRRTASGTRSEGAVERRDRPVRRTASGRSERHTPAAGEPESVPVGGLGALLRRTTEGEHPETESGTR